MELLLAVPEWKDLSHSPLSPFLLYAMWPEEREEGAEPVRSPSKHLQSKGRWSDRNVSRGLSTGTCKKIWI